jgi:hypothetical protein
MFTEAPSGRASEFGGPAVYVCPEIEVEAKVEDNGAIVALLVQVAPLTGKLDVLAASRFT